MSRPTSANLWGDGERGQAIIVFVGILSVVLVMAAVVIDFGLWFAERRSAQRAADLAAAAGAQDLPLAPELAFSSACVWAIENGFDAADVDVEVFTRGLSGVQEGCESAPPAVPACDPDCDTVRVTVSRSAPRLFTALPFFGINDFNVGAVAAAGLTSGGSAAGAVGADQAILLIDAQALMGQGCNRNPTTCAMGRARAEARSFVQTFAGSAGALVGYAPYTHCYHHHNQLPSTYPCVSEGAVSTLTDVVPALMAAIDETEAISRGRPNLCMPLLESEMMFAGVPSGGRRTVILLSDGDNRYDHVTSWETLYDYPPLPCRPYPFDERLNNPLDVFLPCQEALVPEERVLDRLALEQAERLKDAAFGVEIFVVGLNVCGVDDGYTQDSPGYCDQIRNEVPAPDSTTDQRLLKCIASSPEHYQSVDIDGLASTFQDIASEIVSRSLLQ